jgi:hypothetical protein
VDGLVRFDIKKDADDMRVYVDPKQAVDITVLEEGGHNHDACMQGAEYIFGKTFGFIKD